MDAFKKGFTLIELLVAIAIIGILASITVVSIMGVRVNARNAKRNTDINSYATAVQMAINDNGEAPDPGDTVFHCLGDPSGGPCGFDDSSPTSISIHSIFLNYFSSLPFDNFVIDLKYEKWRGYVYRCSSRSALTGICNAGRIWWFLEGVNQKCGRGTVVYSDYPDDDGSGNTWCQINISASS